MKQSSILERFSAPLCNSLRERKDASGLIDALLQRHLFQEEARVFCLAERGVPLSELMRLGDEAEQLVTSQ